ncbi:rod shape-determining protein RodA [Haoranjiania flava]|uniref:Cell wall polymerase n=1 Tax=Haoranjiania flava TaxID=1856322 RepID=A0AAE3LJD7_9BACT|nr:rod shape-determining protein RodA [Haoranjiania flava]MCU7693627.1 rod shape-determining protein RodA [Haoranjiania flava]
MYREESKLSKGIDWVMVWLYGMLVAIGILCIFMVEYDPDSNWASSFFSGNTNYSKQLIFAIVSAFFATLILLSDSKLYTSFANLSYLLGLFLMILTFMIGKNISGSRSWIPLGGGFNLQPAEVCKIFTSLALAKYLSMQDLDFSKMKSQLIAVGIAMLPALLSILQNETGLALVYCGFFIVMFREGLPPWILIVGFSFAVLVIATLLVDPNTLAVILSLIALGVIWFMRRKIKRNRSLLLAILLMWAACVGTQRFAVPYIFNNVLQCYQTTRVYAMVGKPYDCSLNAHAQKREAQDKKVMQPDDYNVRQSKIAIGSGGLTGRGFLKGTQTRGKYVPEQHTDFIFTSVGEAFGFLGSVAFLGVFLMLLLRILRAAERQRSAFSRIYAYCVASILFMHIAINVCMTIGLFPVVGIPLPLISYGGSSLLSFTILIFILIRLDADRNMVLR